MKLRLHTFWGMLIYSSVLALVLTGCATEGITSPTSGSNMLIRVDTQPPSAVAGDNVVIVTAHVARKWSLTRPLTGMHVYVRVGETGQPVLAVEQGHSGIYRCKVTVQDPHEQELYLDLAYRDEPNDPFKMIVKMR